MKTECAREPEILEALAASRWPDACGSELGAHVAHCSSCADLVEVVLALVDEHHVTTRSAPVPSSGIVWWRAQMRARREAERVANRPITVVQGLALTAAAVLAVVLAVTTSALLFPWLPPVDRVLETVKEFTPAIPVVTLLTPLGLLLAAIVAISVVAAPLAVYFAVSDE